jgi:septal ring factor EnvC (AmiA/AmiB activator)
MIVIDHGDKRHSLYAHLAELAVAVGDRVVAGDVLGLSGSEGTEEPCVYFEMRYQGRPEDPAGWLRTP